MSRLFATLMLLGLAGCEPARSPVDVVRANAAFEQSGDLEGYRSTVIEGSPAEERAGGIVGRAREQSRQGDFEKCEILEQSDDEARVAFVRVVKQAGGNGQRITGTHVLHKAGGEWRIGETLIERVEFL